MLLARRRAPTGGFFADLDRGAGVFGVVGTGFAVLLAFVIFIAFESYGTAKEQAGLEAVAVTQLFRVARLFPPPDRDVVQAQLGCYARAVVRDEWPAMREERESPLVEGWLAGIERAIDRVPVVGDQRQVAYGHWFDQAAERREGRRGRLAEAAPFVPPVVWFVLVLAGLLVIAYVCAFADPAERWWIQSLMMIAVASTVVSGLVLVRFLDRPYQDGDGSVRPTAMLRALDGIERATPAVRLPCDARGAPA